ncbi:MAG TPA: hypothetical protein VJY15_19290 [Candidatus Acidoferrum sp.]|nr:hypothetical protein [Candidatus Acidoferrum sp.]
MSLSPNGAPAGLYYQAGATAYLKPPPGFARWTLRLLEEKVVELQIVDRASDSTIGRVLKKSPQAPY